MKCVKCHNMDTKVVDSRGVDMGQTIRRRRECEFCSHRFTTFERREFTELIVTKKDGTKEIYDRQKLKKAIMLAFAKRKVEREQIESIINNLEMQRISDGSEIDSQKIGDDVLITLKEIDIVAYLRFASVYKSFSNIEDFKKFIQ